MITRKLQAAAAQKSQKLRVTVEFFGKHQSTQLGALVQYQSIYINQNRIDQRAIEGAGSGTRHPNWPAWLNIKITIGNNR